MVNSNASTTHLPPLHGDDEQESRTTLFKGRGDDVVQPTLSNPTHPKSLWTSKVNSFHYVIHYMSPLDVILLDHYPCVLLVMTVTSPREDGQDARGMESDKTVAWKRRRKKKLHQEVLPDSPRYYRPDQPPDVTPDEEAVRTGTTASSAPVLPPHAIAVLPRPLPRPLPHLPGASGLAADLSRKYRPGARYYRTPGTAALGPVLPLRASLRAEKALVPCNLIHPPTPLVNTINRTPFAQIWDRLCFEIRVELGSPPQDGLLPPLAGMVPPLVEKIPSWIQEIGRASCRERVLRLV